MSKPHPTPAVQPEVAATLKVQHTLPMSRGGQGVQALAQMGAQLGSLPRVARKPGNPGEEDDVAAAHAAEADSEGLRVADTELAPLPLEMGAQQLAQLAQAPVAAGAGGVGAGVTGVGLAGAPGSSLEASLGAAGVQTVAAVWSVPGWLPVGAAGAVGMAATTNSLKGDDTVPSVTAAQSFSYPENSANGARVGTVAATDNVGVTGFRFSATGTSTSADGYFSIDANGAVTLTQAGAAAGVASNDFETGANSFTYGVQARDAAGNWSNPTNVTFNLTDVNETVPLEDEWADSYDDNSGLPAGSVEFSGTSLSEGYINTESDLDVFYAEYWWNGVYEINVTGQLAAGDLSLNLLEYTGSWEAVAEPGHVNFSLVDDQILLNLNSNFSSGYEYPEATFFDAVRDYYLQVGAKESKTGSYAFSIKLIDDYVDQIVLENGVMQPNYGVDADQTRDLGLGVIVRTQTTVGGQTVGAGKDVKGLFNYQGDIDIWKYAGTAGEEVTVSLSKGDLLVLDDQGNVLQATAGKYTLTGDTYLQVSQGNIPVDSFYQLQLFGAGLLA